jgi:hypothetical protein
MNIMYKSMPVPLTGINTVASRAGKYLRVTPKLPGVKEVLEDRIEYRVGKKTYFNWQFVKSTVFLAALYTKKS